MCNDLGVRMATKTPVQDILQTLNGAQRRAVTSDAPTVAILAGPGSGKTHTLTSRVVWLVQEKQYRPADIVIATFTVKAAREMKDRIKRSLGDELGNKFVLGTFHSIARRYLSTYGKLIGLNLKFGIADDGDSRAIIQRICKRHDLGIEPPHARSWISKKKARGQSLPQPRSKDGKVILENPSMITCYTEYQDHLLRSNLLDYDDLLTKCVELLQQFPSCVSNVQAVLIDEYQDTNGVQYELMKLFAHAKQRITIVGDPDQSIYGWRSAEIKNLYRLLRDYPKTDEISLEENYRSSHSILSVALDVIQQDKKRYQKVLLPVHSKGARPVLRRLKSAPAEGEWIVAEIKRIILMFGGMLKHEDIAILLRSASLSRTIEAALGKAGIAYRMVGGHKFYERREIKILLDYLRVIYQPANNDALARIINVPRRGIGEGTIKSLMEEAEQTQVTLWTLLWTHCRGGRQAHTKIKPQMEAKLNTGLIRVIQGVREKIAQLGETASFTLLQLVEKLISDLRFKQHLEAEFAEDHEQRWSNVQEFITLAADFTCDPNTSGEEALPKIENVGQTEDDDILGKFLANVALAADAQVADKGSETSSPILISTIHAAKGLEWPVVFVPSVYTGSIPHSRAEDLDEERRLLYVAMTRAKSLLYLSCPLLGSQGQGFGSKAELSTFVADLPTATFANQGPSFDQSVVETVAKILGREIPTASEIFKQLPAMAALEDNLFPIDPNDFKAETNKVSGASTTRRPLKRQCLGSAGMGNEEGYERLLNKEYATTMEQASAFTMASLPGFVTAGEHRTTLAAARHNEDASTTREKGPSKQTKRGGTSRRPADQSSLMGFVTQAPESRVVTGSCDGRDSFSSTRHQVAAKRSIARSASSITSLPATGKPSLDPSLVNHKIPTDSRLDRPSCRPSEDDASRKRYANFSSSPVRATSPDREQNTKENSYRANAKPVASFHATTFASATAATGALRRPNGLGPPPTIDRLRKPFKPLTMNRPQ